MYLTEELQKKWAPVMEHPELPAIKDPYRKAVTALLLENQEKALRNDNIALDSGNFLSEAVHANLSGTLPDTGGVAKFDPILISLVRRAMPNLIAYDVCGVQPMTGPTGLIFAMKARYATQGGDEALYNEANTGWSSNNATQAHVAGAGPADLIRSDTGAANTTAYLAAAGVATAGAEGFGDTQSLAEMAFTIEKVTVTAKSRALKAEYTLELAQDLKAVHGLDAETELANILSAEILSEINREVIRTIYRDAAIGADHNTTTAGIFDLDTDSNGRWSVEKFKGLMFQVEREANMIAKDTRRGKGNIIITSSDVASAFQMAGVLDYAPAMDSGGLNVDDTGNPFVGILNGRYKVYVDPYAPGSADNWFCVGYKGSSAYDAGIFYCPYVPLQMVRAVNDSTFQPKIGFKTRYGLTQNPFAQGTTLGGAFSQGTNLYYRLVRVQNLM
jgi:hypothetical protein